MILYYYAKEENYELEVPVVLLSRTRFASSWTREVCYRLLTNDAAMTREGRLINFMDAVTAFDKENILFGSEAVIYLLRENAGIVKQVPIWRLNKNDEETRDAVAEMMRSNDRMKVIRKTMPSIKVVYANEYAILRKRVEKVFELMDRTEKR